MNNRLLLDEETGDLAIQVSRGADGKITTGLQLGNTDYQNINLVVLANKGDFKEHPIVGVGIAKYLKSVGRASELRREISVQLSAIGYPKAQITVMNDGKLEIEI